MSIGKYLSWTLGCTVAELRYSQRMMHWQCEPMIFGNFFESLRQLLRQSGSWREGEPLTPAIMQFLGELFPSFDERDRFQAIFEAYERGGPSPEMKVTLREVAFMKLFCDSYFLGKFVKPMVAASKTGAIAPE